MGPPGATIDQASAVDACEAMLKQIASQNLFMEAEAQEPFDYRLVPFPLAVALYVLDAVGALPPKMTWSLVMMLVPILCHIELAITPNKIGNARRLDLGYRHTHAVLQVPRNPR